MEEQMLKIYIIALNVLGMDQRGNLGGKFSSQNV